jgi:hypothetical protein
MILWAGDISPEIQSGDIWRISDYDLNRAEVNHAHGSYVYTRGILYGRILTWRTEQLVNFNRRYVSATPVRRLLSQELIETTIL